MKGLRNVAGYGFAILCVLLATILTLQLGGFLAPMQLFFLWCAVLVTAVVAGSGAAFFAVALAAGVATYLILAPVGSLELRSTEDLLRLTLFVVLAGALSAAVGARRSAQRRASAAGEWLRTIISSIGDAVIATDSAGLIVLMNPAAEQLTGWNRADAAGRPLDEVLVIERDGPLDSGPVNGSSRASEAIRTRQITSLSHHVLIVRRDGTKLPIEDSAAPIIDRDGEVIGAVLVFHDVSETRRIERLRSEAEKALRASEARYRTLVEAAPVAQAVWTATPEGAVTWSDEWLRITGQEIESFQKEGASAVVHPDDLQRTTPRWKRSLESGGNYEDEIRVRTADGRFRWFAIRAVPRRDETNTICEWVGVVADIDERKRRELETEILVKATRLLYASLDYGETLRTLAKICIPDLGDWCAIYSATEGSGYELLAVEHADAGKAKLVSEADATLRLNPRHDPISRVIESGRSELVSVVNEEVARSLDPSPQQAALLRELGLRSWMIVPIISRGRTLGAISVVIAESLRVYSEEDLPLLEELGRRAGVAMENARLYRDAEAASRAKDEFLATLSHELRTPLTSILGWATMIQDGGLDEDTGHLAVETIVRSARTQADLIDDLLDLSRAIAGKLQLKLEAVDMGELVQQVVIAARPAADARRIFLRSQAAAGVVVRGDDRRLRQVLWNLVTNAVKFTDPGGEVNVTLEKSQTHALIKVCDTGRGIEAAFLPFVWERFRQADSSTARQHGGLGLGLAVTRQLVEVHGGSVSATSDGLGQGATFLVELPLHIDESAAAAGTSEAVTDQALQGSRILVVDDESDARVVIAAMLRRAGAEVLTASSADEAMTAISRMMPDVIVSDLAMPAVDGFAFLERLRAVSAVPVIALSAMGGSSQDRARILSAGFADFARKPVEAGNLAELVAKQLAH